MSTDLSAPAASPASSEPSPSFLSILGNLLVSPREAFQAIVKNPSPWLALAVFVVVHIAFMAVWMSKIDVMEFMANQQAETGKEGPLPPASAAPIIKAMFWLSGTVFPVLLILLTALVLMFIYRFFFEGNVTFKQSFAIVTYAWLITALVTIPLFLGAMAMKAAWSEPPDTVLSANATLVLDRASTPKPLYVLAQQLDLFRIWLVFLTATGFAVAIGKKTGAVHWGVTIPWLILVLIGVGWAAIF
jgi:Yip1-like protein